MDTLFLLFGGVLKGMVILAIIIFIIFLVGMGSAVHAYFTVEAQKDLKKEKNNEKKIKYNMIVAADMNWCIGNNGRLLVHLPEDMKIFRAITLNKVIIMGKNTQKSFPNALFLKNRVNIVLSKTFKNDTTVHYDDTIVHYNTNIEDIPSFIKNFNQIYLNNPSECKYDYITNGDVFVIGGGQIYTQFLENDLIDTIYLTRIHDKYDGDTFIPNLYDLGFKEIDTIVPLTTNADGISYSISILKK